MNDYIQQFRLGYRVPRSILLPPYLTVADQQYFEEFMNAVDHVWSTMVDSRIDVLTHIRNMWVTNPTVEQKIINEEPIDFSDWSRPEREILVKQVNLLGMKLKSAGLLTNDNYLTISRFLGFYWFGKGTQAFIEFINFALVADLEVHNLWSTVGSDPVSTTPNGDYNNFTRENDDGTPPGTPIWEGGPWFPTTHVEITANGGLQGIDAETLAEFFYEIANYNLVLASIESSYDIPIVDTIAEGDTTATVVAIGIYFDPNVVISTAGRYGAEEPPSQEVNGIPTTMLRPAGAVSQSNVLLTTPNSWFLDAQGRKFPVYDQNSRVVQTQDWLPTNIVGVSTDVADPTELTGYTIIEGPFTYVAVPGAPRSQGRMPAFAVIPTAQTNAPGTVPTTTIGGRTKLLSNPAGWALVGGSYVPYWN
ncbi:MAG: hypothetical protein ACN6OP_28205 [Pseudomonadales bacterium]